MSLRGKLERLGGLVLAITLAKGANAQIQPVITEVLNGASYTNILGAGAFVSIFGNNLTPCAALTSQLPTQYQCNNPVNTIITVTENGVPLLLSYVSPTQINAITTPTQTGTVQIRVNNSAPFNATIGSTGLGIFSNNHLAASIINTQNNTPNWYNNLISLGPTGAIITVFGTGGGPVTSTQTLPAGTTTISINNTQPLDSVSIDGQVLPNSALLFSGLAPGYQGLWQYDIQIPTTLPNSTPLATSTAHTMAFTLNGIKDTADFLVGPGVGGVIIPTNSSLTAARAPVALTGTVTTTNQTSPVTGYGNYVAPPTTGNVHLSVNGQGQYANLERDTTTTAIATTTVLKIPELVVDTDAKFTYLNNHPSLPTDVNSTANLFWQAGTQSINNHDFALYSNTLDQYLNTFLSYASNNGGWNSWTYNNLPIMVWPSFPVQVTNINGAPAGTAVFHAANLDLPTGLRTIIGAMTVNGQQVFTEVAQCDPNKPCVQFEYIPPNTFTTPAEFVINQLDINNNLKLVTIYLPNITDAGWLYTARHELGHSQGLFLHSPSPTHVMYQYQDSAPPGYALTPVEQSTLDYLYTLRDSQQRMNLAETRIPTDMSKALQVNTNGVVTSSATAHSLQSMMPLSVGSTANYYATGSPRLVPEEGFTGLNLKVRSSIF